MCQGMVVASGRRPSVGIAIAAGARIAAALANGPAAVLLHIAAAAWIAAF
jgi:hypothetical protein